MSPGPWRTSTAGEPSSRPTRPRGSWYARPGVPALEREVSRQLGEEWRRDRPAAHQPPPLPLSRASVVVPTNFGRPAELRRCLKTLAELDHPDYEVIVVDNRPAGAPAV